MRTGIGRNSFPEKAQKQWRSDAERDPVYSFRISLHPLIELTLLLDRIVKELSGTAAGTESVTVTVPIVLYRFKRGDG